MPKKAVRTPEELAQIKARAERMAKFIDERYDGNRKGFAEASRVVQTRLSEYLSAIENPADAPTPGGDVIDGFIDAGMNPSWWLREIGPMDVGDLTSDKLPMRKTKVLDAMQLHSSLGELLQELATEY